jgi:curved DNA-binding protein CbpA
MVKADVKRDYYADLDLPSTADGEEIKKQFRYLGRQRVRRNLRDADG